MKSKMFYRRLLTLFFLDIGVSGFGLLPLQGEDDGEFNKKTPGCKLGPVFHELGETWHPTLEPQGEMFCVLCKCMPVEKKNILQRKGKVICKNIKDECSVPKCDTPELLPGQCCKTCPQKGFSEETTSVSVDGVYDYTTEVNDGKEMLHDYHRTEYMALLLGKTMKSPTRTKGSARGAFTLFKSNLHFTFYANVNKITRIEFVDFNDNVLYEHVVKPTKEKDNKICGVWNNLPTIYQRFLNNQRMRVRIVTKKHEAGELGGEIIKHRALEDETLSAVLSSDVGDGSGALVMMTVGGDGSLSFIVRHNGLLDKEADAKTIVSVYFMKNSEVLQRINVIVSRHDAEFAELWSKLQKQEFKQLARGKITILIRTESGKQMKGKITPKITCNALQAVLSGYDALQQTETGAGGSAIFILKSNGYITYQIKVEGLKSKLTELSIEGAPNKRDRRRRVAKLTKKFKQHSKTDYGGMARGILKKLNGRQIHLLLTNGLFVNIKTSKHKVSELRGQITQTLFDDKISMDIVDPVILNGASLDPKVPTPAAGHAWVTIDSRCNLRYSVIVQGLSHEKLSPHLHGIVEIGATTGDILPTQLKGFVGNMAQGYVNDLSTSMMRTLDGHNAFIQVKTNAYLGGELRAKIHIPNDCEGVSDREIMNDKHENAILPSLDVSGKYGCNDGDSWLPDESDPCTTCSCKRGKMKCHQAICPKMDCEDPITIEGECCPQCIEQSSLSSETCYFNGDQRRHRVGTIWHPYVPPFGYVKCALCSCVPGADEVNCTQNSCPPLNCPDSEAIRLNESDCCKICPAKPPNSVVADTIDVFRNDYRADDAAKAQIESEDSNPGSCKWKGDLYNNGDSWHPNVSSVGRIKCITCTCKDSVSQCKRTNCPKLRNCRRIKRKTDSCCPVCADNKRGKVKSSRTGKRTKRRRNKNKQ
ncbi:unnamed protein product [Owenia fusiformis]|uniref:Uncharacterized protein n=1 Tax=Owenia fusiformis TaxID=6347 RepID=A0A8J1UCU0_OWEFU|nr:unnamed protein product [Owenia fusiformis]